MRLSVTIQGLGPLLSTLGVDVGVALQPALHAIGEEVRGEITQAPGPVAKPIEWASEKQRRAYVAKRRSAGLGPYVRESDPQSQRLIASWTVQDRAGATVVGNRTSYGPFVQSEEMQQPMHRNTGWVTDAQAVEKVVRSGVVERIVGQRLAFLFRRR